MAINPYKTKINFQNAVAYNIMLLNTVQAI